MTGRRRIQRIGWRSEIFELAERLEMEHPEAAEIANLIKDTINIYTNTELEEDEL